MDSIWLEEDLRRTIRIRDALPYEFNKPFPEAKPGFTWRVIVKAVEAGVSARIAMLLVLS